LLKPTNGLEGGLSVHFRHHDIEAHQDKAVALFEGDAKGVYRLFAINGDIAGAVRLEHFPEQKTAGQVIFNDKYTHRVPPKWQRSLEARKGCLACRFTLIIGDFGEIMNWPWAVRG
jgi:hypothetical protein